MRHKKPIPHAELMQYMKRAIRQLEVEYPDELVDGRWPETVEATKRLARRMSTLVAHDRKLRKKKG